MTAKFAGSGSVDDRRRRRLAQESMDTTDATPPKRRREPKTKTVKALPVEQRAVKSDVVADESIIPASIWKALALSGLGFTFWGILIWLNLRSNQLTGLELVISPRNGSGFQFLSVLAQLGTAQLSFLIFWYRSRSRKDFGGRYRVWGWAGIFWAITCLFSALKIYQPLASIAAEIWPIHFWRPEVLYWFVPFSIGVLALHQLLAQDMRLSKLSKSLWAATLTIGLFAGGLTLGLDYLLPESTSQLIHASTVTCWQLMVMTTMLIHARFVVHVTNEAAPKRKTFLRRIADNVRVRTTGLRLNVSEWTAARAEKKKKRRELAAAAKAEKRASRESKRAEKTAAAKARSEKLAAEKKAKIEAAQQQKSERLEKQQAVKAKRRAEKESAKAEKLAQIEAAREEREKLAAEKKAKIEAAKQAKSESKQKSSSSEETTDDQRERSQQASRQTTKSRKRKRVLGSNSRIDSAESTKQPHSSSSYPDEDYDEDFDDSRPMSKKERRRLRKQKRQRSQ